VLIDACLLVCVEALCACDGAEPACAPQDQQGSRWVSFDYY
jgi:hypothetical protein